MRSTEPSCSTEFATFMHAYQDMVFSTAVRLTGNDAQAEDIAQEVFMKAYEGFEHLRSSPTAGGWLKTVTRNLSLNHLGRYRKRWRFFSEMASAEEEDSPGIDVAVPDRLLEELSDEQRSRLVEDALRRLPEHQRVPLVLYHFEELSYEEIAARLGVSLSKVKTDISRGRGALLPLLKTSAVTLEDLRDERHD